MLFLVLVLFSGVLAAPSTKGITFHEFDDSTCKTPATESTFWLNDKCIELEHSYSKVSYDGKSKVVMSSLCGENCTNCQDVDYDIGKCAYNTTVSWGVMSKASASFYAYVYKTQDCSDEPEMVAMIEAQCETSQGTSEKIFCDSTQSLQIAIWEGKSSCSGDPTYTFPYPPKCLNAGVQYELSSCQNLL